MKDRKKIEDIEKEYNFEFERIIKSIKKEKAKKVLLQFPDGLKPYAIVIEDKLKEMLTKEKNSAEFFIWFDSCFGACDIPLEVEKLGIDLIVQFGHSAWNFESKSNFGINVVK